MLKKSIKYLLWVAVIGLLAFNSVYVKDLKEMKATEVQPFNAGKYAREYLYTKLPSRFNKSHEVSSLIASIKRDTLGSFASYGFSQNKGDVSNFLVSGQGAVTAIEDDNVVVKLRSGIDVRLATEYIFGNTVRDAAGLVSMDDFSNSMDLNNVSEEINRLIKSEILPPFKAKVKAGDEIKFIGCIELNQANLRLDDLEIIPVSLTIKN